MRRLLLLLSSASCLVGTPALAASQCAAPLPAAPVVTPPLTATPSASPPVTPETPIIPAQGDAVAHLKVAGSSLDWQTPAYGWAVGVLRQTDQVMLFMTPQDHRYVIGGTIIPVPYARLREMMGHRATDLKPVLGVPGMFVTEGDHFRIVYASPDGRAAMTGTLWDAAGKNITRQQIRFIPGAVPNVTLSGPQMPGTASLYAGEIGSPHAPEVMMFIDPRCMYSMRALSALQPAVDAGRIRLKVIPLSLLDYEDQGASTLYARAMVSQPAGSMVQAWSSGSLDRSLSSPAPDAAARLEANMVAARDVSVRGTPTFFWKHGDGTVGRLDGVPTDIAGFIAKVTL